MNDMKNITVLEAFEMLERGQAVEILDVRQPEEYREVRIEPSRLLPLGELTARVGELDPSRTLLALCRSGKRSAMAARQLAALGFRVHNIDGGILAWMAGRLPVSRGE